MFKYVFLLTICGYSLVFSEPNNVCKTYPDYFFLYTSPNCWYDPELTSNVPDIIRRNGYPFENYETTTEDGYILNVYRIPNYNSTKSPILLVHPILTSSGVWFHYRNKSLSYLLSDNGYDVWIANLRGSYLSPNHTQFSSTSNEYWSFSFHEIGLYDIPATIDLILSKTNSTKVTFFGHSMSASSLAVYCSLKPDRATSTINAAIVYAPVIYLSKTGFRALAPFWKPILAFTKLVHTTDLLAYNGAIHKLIKFICAKVPGAHFYCHLLILAGMGESYPQSIPYITPSIVAQNFAGVALKNFAHYGQIYLAGGDFRFYDYGFAKNLILYNSTTPPSYPIKNIKVPHYIYYGTEDRVVYAKDILKFAKNLPPESLAMEPKGLPFNHIDIYYAKDAPIVYQEFLRIVNNLH